MGIQRKFIPQVNLTCTTADVQLDTLFSLGFQIYILVLLKYKIQCHKYYVAL